MAGTYDTENHGFDTLGSDVGAQESVGGDSDDRGCDLKLNDLKREQDVSCGFRSGASGHDVVSADY